jgi:glutathione S-transferase
MEYYLTSEAMHTHAHTHVQGIGRHSLEEVVARMKADFEVCEALLTESGQYLTGETITQADCFLWGLLDMVCIPVAVVYLSIREAHLLRVAREHSRVHFCLVFSSFLNVFSPAP